LVTTPPKTLNLADPRARHVLPPKKRFRIDNPTDTDKSRSKGSQTTTMPEDTSNGLNASEERSIDNPMQEPFKPTYIKRDNMVDVTHKDPKSLDHIRSKAISVLASELTRDEAEILVKNNLVRPPGKPTLNTDLKHKCQFCDIMGHRVSSFKYPYQITQHYRCHINDRQFRCNQCPMSFNRPVKLEAHKRRNHNGPATTKCDRVESGTNSSPSE
jgi:hypothetical protein